MSGSAKRRVSLYSVHLPFIRHCIRNNNWPCTNFAPDKMAPSTDGLHSPGIILSWKKMQLSKAKLKASSKTSALLSGFAMVAMVEIQLNNSPSDPSEPQKSAQEPVPQALLIAYSVCTTLLVAVHMLALMISTCILPNIEAVSSLENHSLSYVQESPHERLHGYIEIAWVFSTLLGLVLFLCEVALLCWVQFINVSRPAAWAACGILIPVFFVFILFGVHFYRSLVMHKYEMTVRDIESLERAIELGETDGVSREFSFARGVQHV